MALTTRHLAEFLSGNVFQGTASISITTSGIASENANQTITITASAAISINEPISDSFAITASGVERVHYFYDGTATIVMFVEGRAKIHAFDVYKDGLQNLSIT